MTDAILYANDVEDDLKTCIIHNKQWEELRLKITFLLQDYLRPKILKKNHKNLFFFKLFLNKKNSK